MNYKWDFNDIMMIGTLLLFIGPILIVLSPFLLVIWLVGKLGCTILDIFDKGKTV